MRLVAGFPPPRPGFELESGQVGFVVDKLTVGQVFSEYFGFPCQSSFHQIHHPHNHLGQVQYARRGRRAAWTQFGLQPPLCELKEKIKEGKSRTN
jgi:hypothetical protein